MKLTIAVLIAVILAMIAGAMTAFAPPEFQRALRELHWWVGPLVGLVLAVVLGFGVVFWDRRRQR